MSMINKLILTYAKTGPYSGGPDIPDNILGFLGAVRGWRLSVRPIRGGTEMTISRREQRASPTAG